MEVNKWEEVYSRDKKELPWLENPIPEEILENFSSHIKKGETILDYGCGDGVLSEVLHKKGFELVCSDISSKALELVSNKISGVRTVQAEKPEDISKNQEFGGLLAWGVLHHINKEKWVDYIKGFKAVLKPEGMLLIGGHSKNDVEFSEGYRISPTTGNVSTALDIYDILEKEGLQILDSGNFDFKEAHSGKDRSFKYYLAKNIETQF